MLCSTKSILANASTPVDDICSIDQQAQKDLLFERFDTYREKHYQRLHLPHRQSFYHLVLFTKGQGYQTIDFEKFPVQPYQIYFMAPGQVHSWHFESEVDGFLVHFNEALFYSFLHESHYQERFHFFSGNSADGVCLLPILVYDKVVKLFESILQEIAVGKEQNPAVIRLKRLELFIAIDRTLLFFSY